MKTTTFTILLVLATIFSYSQTTFNAGVYAEGGAFLPESEGNGLATGGGIFGSLTFNEKLTLTLQTGYRFKSNETDVTIWNTSGDNAYGYGGYSGYGYGGYGQYVYQYDYGTAYASSRFNQHHIVLPLKVSYLFTKKLFIEAGVSASCILNYDKIESTRQADGSYLLPDTYDAVNDKYEFDWIIGVGYKFSPKLKASVNYTQGFSEQGMGTLEQNGDSYYQFYKNRMLMLNVSYSVFGGK